jgi:hypothetical protein
VSSLQPARTVQLSTGVDNPAGVYGLYGPFSRRAILAMADSMPAVSSPVLMNINC